MILHDQRGTPLTPGAEVAYNMSGTVAKGRIIKAEPGKGSYGKANIHISLEHPACGKPAGHISKVSRPENVLVMLVNDA